MNKRFLSTIGIACAVLALAACQPQPPAPTPTVVTPTSTSQPLRAPYAVIAPDRVRNGDQYAVIGADWPPDADIMLELRQITSADVESISLGRVRADAQGRFTYKGIVSPVMTPGGWTLVAHGSDPVQVVSIPLTIAGGSVGPTGATASATTTTTAIATVTAEPGTATATATTAATASQTPVIVSAMPVVISDWRGMYFNNVTLSGMPAVTRNEVDIDFNWGFGSPDARINPDNFSARWTRRLFFNQGAYRFTVLMDDAARVWLDGVLVLNAWKAGGLRRVSTDVTLKKGYHDVRVEFFERSGVAVLRFTVERAATLTVAPSSTAMQSATATPSATASQTPAASVTPMPSQTVTSSPTAIPSRTPTLTPPPLPTVNTSTPEATAQP